MPRRETKQGTLLDQATVDYRTTTVAYWTTVASTLLAHQRSPKEEENREGKRREWSKPMHDVLVPSMPSTSCVTSVYIQLMSLLNPSHYVFLSLPLHHRYRCSTLLLCPTILSSQRLDLAALSPARSVEHRYKC